MEQDTFWYVKVWTHHGLETRFSFDVKDDAINLANALKKASDIGTILVVESTPEEDTEIFWFKKQ